MKAMPSVAAVHAAILDHAMGLWPDTPVEGDWDVNKRSRALVRAMRREHGEAHIYAPNRFWAKRDDRGRDSFHMEYRCGMVFNFSGSLVMPFEDETLERLIQERLDAKYTTTARDAQRVDAIFERALSCGALTLNWV